MKALSHMQNTTHAQGSRASQVSDSYCCDPVAIFFKGGNCGVRVNHAMGFVILQS